MNANELFDWIYDNQEQIKADIRANNPNARNIATLYNMIKNYDDSSAFGLLQAAVDEYRVELEKSPRKFQDGDDVRVLTYGIDSTFQHSAKIEDAICVTEYGKKVYKYAVRYIKSGKLEIDVKESRILAMPEIKQKEGEGE